MKYEIDKQNSFGLFQSSYIRENQSSIINSTAEAIDRINRYLEVQNQSNVTWYYNRYNVFSVMAGNIHFYKIYKDIISALSTFVKEMDITYDEQLWMQCWLNHHDCDEVLAKHDHSSPIHGYVSIEPQLTNTEFYDNCIPYNTLYSIDNTVGQIYIGPGKREHAVINTGEYDQKRITLGFDIDDKNSFNVGMIPIILYKD